LKLYSARLACMWLGQSPAPVDRSRPGLALVVVVVVWGPFVHGHGSPEDLVDDCGELVDVRMEGWLDARKLGTENC
jgi:hypothetical protein